MTTFNFGELSDTHLVVNAVYVGGRNGNVGDDPISKLFKGEDKGGVGNMGGFRLSGSPSRPNLVVLYTSGEETDWPDAIDSHSGIFTYFGDNRTPGQNIHETPRSGNLILHHVFERLHVGDRNGPPFFIFEKEGSWRDVVYRGIAVPGAPSLGRGEDLVSYWDDTEGEPFQNYRGAFSVLDAPMINRRWLDELYAGNDLGSHCPAAWRLWRETGEYLTVGLEGPPEENMGGNMS